MIARLSVGRRLIASLAVLAAGIGLIAAVTTPGALGAYTARITNSANTVTTNPYWTCAQASTALAAAVAWPFDDAGLLNVVGSARDVSGNGRTGTTTIGGVTYRQTAAACPRDLVNGNAYSFGLDGASGYVRYGTSFTLTNTFTLSIWFNTGTTRGGRLIGFGSAATGASGQYDRMIWMSNTGTLTFGVYPNAIKTVSTTASYNDSKWHHAVATLGTTGMKLYVDGVSVGVGADATNTTAQTYDTNAMYLRVGYDNLVSWPNQPTSYYFAGSVRFADYFTTTLSATQVSALYGSGIGT